LLEVFILFFFNQLKQDDLAGLPLLVYANKQDLMHAISAEEVNNSLFHIQ
jgi:signal recognition particle receptor subunit beta